MGAKPDSHPHPHPRILDPACGHGVFLAAACRKLNLGDRVRSQLFGVDTDRDAVEQTRTTVRFAAIADNPFLADSRFPDLDHHLRVGDFLDDETLSDLAPFDIIVGNPPYRRERGHKQRMDAIASTRLGQAFRAPRMDLWHYFVHRALELLKPSGVLGFIVNSYWTASAGASKLIEALRTQTRIVEIHDLRDMKIFDNVNGRHCILILRKGESQPGGDATRIYSYAPNLSETGSSRTFSPDLSSMREVPTADLFREGRIRITTSSFASKTERKRHMVRLGTLGLIRQGIAENPASINRRTNERYGNRWTTGEGVFALREREVQQLDPSQAEQALLRPYHALSDLNRYQLAETPSLTLIYSTKATWPDERDHPRLRVHLERFRPVLDDRRETRLKRNAWHHLHWPRNELIWQAPRKLLCKQMAPRPCFAIADGPAYVSFSVNVFLPDPRLSESLDYLLGWLNSRIMEDWFRQEGKLRGAGPEINGHALARAPIPAINFADPRQCAIHDEIADLSRQLSKLHRERLNPEIAASISQADQRIDELAARLT